MTKPTEGTTDYWIWLAEHAIRTHARDVTTMSPPASSDQLNTAYRCASAAALIAIAKTLHNFERIAVGPFEKAIDAMVARFIREAGN